MDLQPASFLSFPLGVVEAALVHGDTLYVRTYDTVAQVTRSGTVTVLQTFGAQSPLAFKGLVLAGGQLLTLDRCLNAAPGLTAIPLNGAVQRRMPCVLHDPVGLAVTGGHTVVLDRQPPITRLLRWDQGTARVVGEARNLTAWKQLGDELHFSDRDGLHRLHQDRLRTVVEQPGLLAFNQDGLTVTQLVEDGQVKNGPPVLTVTTPVGSQHVTGVGRPVALHRLSTGTFVRFGNRIAPVTSPADLHDLPDASDLGTVTEFGGGLVYLDDNRQLRWSADTRHWACIDPGVRASEIISAGVLNLVVTGRRASAWVSVLPS